MLKPLLALCVIGALSISGQSHANEVAKDLPKSIQSLIGHNTEDSITNIAGRMLELTPDGVITQDIIDIYQKSLLADERARLMQQILSIDLDFDGILDEQDLDAARMMTNRRNSLRRAQLELMLLDADLNSDGMLDFDEIRLHVIMSTDAHSRRSTSRRNRLIIDIMALDTDNDEKVTIPEMAKAIRALSKR